MRLPDKKRRIARAESDDFQHWVQSGSDGICTRGNACPIEELYTSQTHPYFARRNLCPTAARFMINRQVLQTRQAEAIQVDPKFFSRYSDAVLMTSRRNVYDRTFMTAFVAPGIGAESGYREPTTRRSMSSNWANRNVGLSSIRTTASQPRTSPLQHAARRICVSPTPTRWR